MNDLPAGAAAPLPSDVVAHLSKHSLSEFNRIGVSGQASNCAFAAMLTSINDQHTLGRVTKPFRELSAAQQQRIAQNFRERVAKDLTQETLAACDSVLTVSGARELLKSDRSVDDEALKVVAEALGVNVFITWRQTIHQAGGSSTKSFTRSINSFNDKRRSVWLYGRATITVTDLAAFASEEELESLSDDARKRAGTQTDVSGHFESVQQSGSIGVWPPSSTVVTVNTFIRLTSDCFVSWHPDARDCCKRRRC